MYHTKRHRLANIVSRSTGVLYVSKRHNGANIPPSKKDEKLSSGKKSNALLEEMLKKSSAQPNGFKRFYQEPFTSKSSAITSNERILQALMASENEEKIFKEAKSNRNYAQAKRMFFYLLLLGGGSLLYKSDLYYSLLLPSHGDVLTYHQLIVNLIKHKVFYCDEEQRIIAVRRFIDYKALEDSCDPSKDVLVSFSTYFPWIPIMFLMLIPFLALVNKQINVLDKGALSKIGLPQKKFNFKRYDFVTTRLSDVAGLTEAKHELAEVIDFLKRPSRYSALGAKLPKGVLLDGPPGVGKTLLAKAVAGEAGVPFVSCSGSEFDEVYVGVGAKRIRELFQEAHKCKPCVVFIDEIDSFGKKRKSGGERSFRSTLNAFLSEVDGFKDSSGILLLGATNRADILDNAMTRSGRFDRKITLDKPPYKERVAIAHVHLKPLSLDLSSTAEAYAQCIAALTPGCSGADIYSVCNEGAIHAARSRRSKVTMEDFHKAAERVMIGMQKSAVEYLPSEKERLAFHEAGVVVLNWYQKLTAPVIKTTILPCGALRSGVTQMLPQNAYISTENRLRENITGMLGGYVAEDYFFHDVSTRGVEKLREATKMARQMICTYGMDPSTFGHMALTQNPEAIEKPYGPKKENNIDKAVEELLTDCMGTAKSILEERLVHVQAVATLLITQETLSAYDLWLILGDRPVMTKEFQAYLLS